MQRSVKGQGCWLLQRPQARDGLGTATPTSKALNADLADKKPETARIHQHQQQMLC
jgi:hypothetical protein